MRGCGKAALDAGTKGPKTWYWVTIDVMAMQQPSEMSQANLLDLASESHCSGALWKQLDARSC